MSFTSLRRALNVSAVAFCLGACAIPPTPQSNSLAPEERARAIAMISHFMSDGDADSFDSVSKGFDAPLYEKERHSTFGGGTLYIVYRGFQKRSDAFSVDSTYQQTWKDAFGRHPTVSANVSLVMSHDFCLTYDGFRQAFGDQVNRFGEVKGKYSGLATSRNLAMVAFIGDGSCVKHIDIFTRHVSASKATATESH